MLEAGATILDVGGASSRPGALVVPEEEERIRTMAVIQAIHQQFPDTIISIDTWRSTIAAQAVEAGATLINDISAGLQDCLMLPTVAKLRVPYVVMHMQGLPKFMQEAPTYSDVVAQVVKFLAERASAAKQAGIADLVLDPGFGFGKTATHNFTLLNGLQTLKKLGMPVLAGLSRKRMINEVLGTIPAQALNGTTVLNTLALLNGADILRVHDVRPAVEAVKLLAACR